jgi:hypothetical protein
MTRRALAAHEQLIQQDDRDDKHQPNDRSNDHPFPGGRASPALWWRCGFHVVGSARHSKTYQSSLLTQNQDESVNSEARHRATFSPAMEKMLAKLEK